MMGLCRNDVENRVSCVDVGDVKVKWYGICYVDGREFVVVLWIVDF